MTNGVTVVLMSCCLQCMVPGFCCRFTMNAVLKELGAICTRRPPKINNYRPKIETWRFMPCQLWRSLGYRKYQAVSRLMETCGENALCFWMLQPCSIKCMCPKVTCTTRIVHVAENLPYYSCNHTAGFVGEGDTSDTRTPPRNLTTVIKMGPVV